MNPTTGRSLPNAILHVDADAFFAACEVAVNPKLQGLPVVVGKERGIAAALTYEAKRLGITRGMPIGMIKRICPTAVILPGNYELYSTFSKRLFNTMRTFTDAVEPYSIDEGFADVTGLKHVHNMTYGEIAAAMKKEIEKNLGLTVSVGLAPTKVLAKIASRFNKPDGLTVISLRDKDTFLAKTPVHDIWGVGRNTAQYMHSLNIHTAREFIGKDENFIVNHFTKPHQDIWHELKGESIYGIHKEPQSTYGSISRTHTFTPTTDRRRIFSELVHNVETACAKARKSKLGAMRISVFLKRQTFTMDGLDATCTRRSAYPNELLSLIRPMFERLFVPNTLYRASGVTLSDLNNISRMQQSLFEQPEKISRIERMYQVVDTLSETFGPNTVRLASGLLAGSTASKAKKVPEQVALGLPFLVGNVS